MNQLFKSIKYGFIGMLVMLLAIGIALFIIQSLVYIGKTYGENFALLGMFIYTGFACGIIVAQPDEKH